MKDTMNYSLPLQEVWKDINGFEGKYKISNYGRVKSLQNKSPKILCTQEKDGYLMANFMFKRKASKKEIHSLVALAFVGERPVINGERYVIDHIDENKHNNMYLNLRYITNRENVSRSVKNAVSSYTGVYKAKSGRWRASIGINCKTKHLGTYDSELEASEAYQDALRKHLNKQLEEHHNEL